MCVNYRGVSPTSPPYESLVTYGNLLAVGSGWWWVAVVSWFHVGHPAFPRSSLLAPHCDVSHTCGEESPLVPSSHRAYAGIH